MRAVMSERGLAPNKRFGQNFLIEPRILDIIVRLAELAPNDIVLEVGTGMGTLTRRLAEEPSLLLSVEVDSGLYILARDLLGNCEKLRLIHGDIMEGKTRLNAEVCDRLDQALVAPNSGDFKVVSNLPYNISTPFLTTLILHYGMPDRLVLMLQKELAENLVAKPGSKDYSPLSILVRTLAEVRVDRLLGREVFWPRPKVESALVVIESRRIDPEPIARALPLVRFLFGERRKSISGLLKRLPTTMGGASLDEEERARLLGSVDLTGKERAEELPPEAFLALERAIANSSWER